MNRIVIWKEENNIVLEQKPVVLYIGDSGPFERYFEAFTFLVIILMFLNINDILFLKYFY